MKRHFLSLQAIIFGSNKSLKKQKMNEELELERKLKTVKEAKIAAVKEVNFELAANLRAEEKLLLKQLEELKKSKKD